MDILTLYNRVLTAHSVGAKLCPGEEGHGAKTCRHQEKGDNFTSPPWVQRRHLPPFCEVTGLLTFPGHLL